MKTNHHAFTQKHFQKTGAVITKLRAKYPAAQPALDEIVELLIPVFENANPRFKPDLFRHSCGVLSCYGEDKQNEN